MTDTHTILDQCTGLAHSVFANRAGACSAEDAALYLAHTGHGQTIRALASVTGRHPSTVLRTIRRVEERRDDPLIDRMLAGLEGNAGAIPAACGAEAEPDLSETELRREAKRFLRRLSEPGSFLIIAEGAAKGGIFCAANQHRKPIAMLPIGLAGEFLRRDWIRVARKGAVSVRYKVTDVGRAFLKRILAEDAGLRAAHGGFADAGATFRHQHRAPGKRLIVDPMSGETEELAVNLGESPVGWLARRKGPDGQPFLAPEEVEAAERLRSDFEAAQMGPSVAQDWRKFLTPGDRLSGSPRRAGPAEGPMAARDRVAKALGSLGPGLSDVALRVCCFLEGLEACERRMGWSARSGKVVLKIALQRLAEHYGFARPKH